MKFWDTSAIVPQTQTQDMSFVTFDARLREAAHKEGFTLRPTESD